MKYNRVLLKLSGESLMGTQSYGIDPSMLTQYALDIKARDLGILINPSANIHSLPIEAGFVGADNVAVLLAEEPYNSESVKLIIDIGTNGEIDLGNKPRLDPHFYKYLFQCSSY